jgi:glycosyltransferase involved in cell wall biosynthesis
MSSHKSISASAIAANKPEDGLMLPGISERLEHGLVVLSPVDRAPRRRVLFLNNYGGREVWNKVKSGLLGSHHMWGCIELVRQGYEVALAESVPDFNARRPLPHDLRFVRSAVGWLRRSDIIYCGHNVMYWLPFLRATGMLRRHIVSLLFANEPLDFASAHSAVVALTPCAEARARLLAPKAKVAHLGWGVEPSAHPILPYDPQYLLHCGIAGRDFDTLHRASLSTSTRIKIIVAWPIDRFQWPRNVEFVHSGAGYNHQEKKVTFSDLLNVHYARSAASLIVTIPDPEKEHALGFTNLIEALAMSQPIIHTATGALADEIDVEKEGCGIRIPPGDSAALAAAMDAMMKEPDRAEAMGRKSRMLAENRYNIARYARELHQLFETL